MPRVRAAILVAALFGLGACGNNTHAPEVTTPSAAAPTSPVLPGPVGPRSGSITGTVAVPAHAPGQGFVVAAPLLDDLLRNQPTAMAPVRKDGTFTLDYLAPADYYVAAFVDTDGDGTLARGREPYVFWPRGVPVDGLTPTTGITLSNFLDLADPAVRTPERVARVETLHAAGDAAVQELLRVDLAASADPERLLPTLRVLLADTLRQWRLAATDEQWQYVERTLSAIPRWAEAARRGENPLADARGWQVLGFVREFDGGVFPYILYVPPDYRQDEPLPLTIALHGGGGTHWSGARLAVGAGTIAQSGPDRSPHVWPPAPPLRMFILAPLGDRSTTRFAWQGLGEVNVLATLDQVLRRYAVDPDRIYLTGVSDGGSGSWWIGARYPDRFAAILVAAGATTPVRQFGMNLAHVPMRLVHGTWDRIIPVEHARAMVRQGVQYQARLEYQEVDRGHDVADICYGNGAGLKWLAQFTRDPVPPVVYYRTDDVRHSEGPGIVLTEAGMPTEIMDVKVAWADAAHVDIESRNVAALTVRVPSGATAPITIRWNGQTLQVTEPAAAIALRAAVAAQGEVVWSAQAAAVPVRRPLGPWTGVTTG